MATFLGLAIFVAVIAAVGFAVKNIGKENAGFPASRRCRK